MEGLATKGIKALVAVGRQRHGKSLEEILGEEQEASVVTGEETARERMKREVGSKEGRRIYGLRKQTVEPVFGIIKGGMRPVFTHKTSNRGDFSAEGGKFVLAAHREAK